MLNSLTVYNSKKVTNWVSTGVLTRVLTGVLTVLIEVLKNKTIWS